MSEPQAAHFAAGAVFPRLIPRAVRDRAVKLSGVGGATALVGAALAVALLTLRFDAPAVVISLLGAFALVYMLLRPAVATAVTLFLIYANLPVLAVRQLGVPTLLAASSVLLLGLPLAHHLLLEKRRLRSDRTLAFMLLFLAAMAASALFAPAPGIAAERMRVYAIEGIALYWLILNVVRDLPAFRRAVWTLLTAGALLGALGTWQAVTDTYGRSFGGLAHRQVEVVSAEQGLGEDVHLRVSRRAEGPVDEPNRFAQILIVLLPLALLNFRSAASRRARVLAALAGALVLAGVFLTYSRGAFLVLVALFAAVVRLGWLRARHAFALALVVALALPLIAPTYQKRIASIGGVRGLLENRSQVHADGAIRGRTTEMLAALNVFADHPLLGVGPGQYSPIYSVEYQNLPGVSFRDIAEARRAHSLYLELAAELGIVGLTVFLAMVGLLLRDLMRQRRQAASREMSELSTALALGLAAYLGTALFLHLSYERYFWLLLAVASAGLHLARGGVAAAAAGGDGVYTLPLPVPPHSTGPRRREPLGGLVTPPSGWASGVTRGRAGRAPRPRLGAKRLVATLASAAAEALTAGTTLALKAIADRVVTLSRALAARSKVFARALIPRLRVGVTEVARNSSTATRAFHRSLTCLSEEIRSRFVMRALDAFLTASIIPFGAAELEQPVFPTPRSHYRRVQRLAKGLERLFPRTVFCVRKGLIRVDRLPISGCRTPETLGYGARCTVFHLARHVGRGRAGQHAVLKVDRDTLGRGLPVALTACRAQRELYRRMAQLYDGADLVVKTTFLVLHAPLLGCPATVTIQPRLDRGARDLFLECSDRELLSALRADARFAHQLRVFVTRTTESVRTTGRCLDLVGRGNVMVVSNAEGSRMRIIDFGEIDLADWARNKPAAEREARRRLDRLERLSVGVNPRVEKALWRP